MEMDTTDRYILCVYESGSMSKAAKILGLSQPALSMTIGNLEKKLGYQLFNRKTKPISLTAEGQIYLEYLNQHSILLDDLKRKMSDLHEQKNEHLTIGGSVVYVESMIAPLVPLFCAKHPECTITIKSAPLQELIRNTVEGEMDCFISTSKEIPEQFKVIPLKKERIYLGIPKGWEINQKLAKYQVQLGREAELMDYSLLKGLPYISLLKKLPLQKKMDAFWEEMHLQPTGDVVVNQVSTALNLALKGVGMVAASEEALANISYEGHLCLYALPEAVSDQTIYAAVDAKRYMPAITKELITLLQENSL